MPVDPTPWFREGASHSANIARVLAHAAFGGQGGIIGSTDCEVRELAIPGTSVRVYPGVVAMPNRANGAPVKGEMFGGRVESETEVPIAATGAGAGRSDMIVARVYTLGETPPVAGQFFDLYVISGVPAGATRIDQTSEPDVTGVPLARIDLPASTGTILQAHITDLRKMATTFHASDGLVRGLKSGESDVLNSADWVRFPNLAGCELITDVPEWATHAQVRVGLAGAYADDSEDTHGKIRARMVAGAIESSGPATDYDITVAAGTGIDRYTLLASGEFFLPASIRGTSATFDLTGRHVSGSNFLKVRRTSVLSIDVEFKVKPETNL